MASIMDALSLAPSDRKMLSNLLADMCRQNIISCPKSKKDSYTLVKEVALAEGVVEVHPRGFGFAIIGDTPGTPTQKSDKSLRQDPFIAPDNLGSAHQGDKALFRLVPKKRGRTRVVGLAQVRAEAVR